MAGPAVGGRVEFPVGDLPFAVDQRDPVGETFRLCLEPLHQRDIVDVGAGAGPGAGDEGAFLLGENVKGADPVTGVRHDLLEDAAQDGHQALHGAVVEQVPREEHRPVQSLVVVGAEQELEVELGRTVHDGHHVARRVARQAQTGGGGDVKGEADLEERVTRERANGVERFEDEVEGRFLVGEGVQVGGTDPRQQVLEGRVPAAVGAQHQGVDEEADQFAQLLVAPAGDRRTHRQVGAGAETGQGGDQGGVDHHERRAACLLYTSRCV